MREGSQNRARIGKKWRKPRGLQSKMRHQFAGHRAKVKVGYRSPAMVRNLDKEGLKLVNIQNINDLNKLDSKIHKVIISSRIGAKKKIILLGTIIEKGFKVYFCKDPVKKLDDLRNSIKKKKVEKLEKKKVKKDKKEKKEKTKKKPELEEKVLSADDKKKKDQKEMEKVITKRE